MKKYLVLALALLVPVTAQPVVLPYSYTAGETIRASYENANNQALRDAINNHDSNRNAHNSRLQDILAVGTSAGSYNIDFDFNQALDMRVENVLADPSCAAGSLGKVIWNSTSGLFKVCNGTSYVLPTSSGLSSNPTDCGANAYATAIDASGNLTCGSITNAATTATNANTASAIVARDGSGNFSAGTITANLTGEASVNTTNLNSHLADGTDAHDASSVSVSAIANLTATEVQAALAEHQADIDAFSIGAVAASSVSVVPAGNIASTDVQDALEELDTEKLSTSGTAALATALAANPTDCGANQHATGIDASGNLTCSAVANASTTATSANTNSAIVARDGSGNFSAGTITASLTGNVTGALTGNASTATALAANPTDCGADEYATSIDASGNLTCAAAAGGGGLYSEGQNLISNSSFKTNTTGWSSSGTGTGCTLGTGFGRTTTNGQFIPPGAAGLCFDAGASSERIEYTATTINANDGLAGRNGVVSVALRAASGTATHVLQAYDGTNVLASQTVTSSTTQFSRTSLNFIFPSSGTVQFRLVSAADEPVIYVDDAFMGLAEGFNMANVSQATLVGNAYIASTASCVWSNTGATLDAFATTAACPGPTVVLNPGPGVIQPTDTNLPEFTVNNLPPGNYEVTITGHGDGTGSGNMVYAINDGTDTRGRTSFEANGADSSAITIVGHFSYGSTANRTFAVWSAASANTNRLQAQTGGLQLEFSIKRFPTSSETAYRSEAIPGSWAGYHDTTCSNTVTSTTFADLATDASCALVETSNKNFGTVSGTNTYAEIAFTPKVAGTYKVCAGLVGRSGGAAATQVSFGLYDVTGSAYVDQKSYSSPGINYRVPIELCGLVNATSTASRTLRIRGASSTGTAELVAGQDMRSVVEWSIYPVTQNVPAPVLVGSVGTNSTGQERLERAEIDCDGGATVTSQSGSWVSAVGNISAGSCALTLASGIFSATPTCTCTTDNADEICAIEPATSATSITVRAKTNAGAASTGWIAYLHCMGPR